jgi:hypothetical protein
MKTKFSILVAVFIMSIGAAVPLTADNTAIQHKGETDKIIHRMDEFIRRTELIAQDMKQLMKGVDKQASAKFQLMLRMSEGVRDMATHIKATMQQSQLMMEDKTLMKDEQFQRDIIGLRDQMDRMTSCMSNTLQYMEHMTYRLDVTAAGR